MAELQQLINSIQTTQGEDLDNKRHTHDIMQMSADMVQMSSARRSPTTFIRERKASVKKCVVSPPEGAVSASNNLQLTGTLDCVQQQLKDARALPDSDQIKVIDQVIEAVIEAHMSTCNYTADKVAEGKKKYESSGYATRAVNMAKHSMEMMKGGLEPSKMWAQMVKQMEPVMVRIITFAKKVPGFSELSNHDQVELIRQGSFEVVLSRYSRLFEETSMFLPTMDVKLPRSMVKHMPMGSFFEEQFKFCGVFNPLALEDGELALLSAVMLMCPEREGLDDHKTVFQLQGLFLQALYTYMKRLRPDNYNEMFIAAVNSLPLMEEVNDLHTEMLQSSNIQTPQLHRDVFL